MSTSRAAGTPSPAAPAHPSHPSRVTLMAGLMIAVVAFQLNATMLNPAVQNIQNELHTTTAQVGRSASLFFLSTGVFALFLPRLSDILGRKRVLLGVLILLCAGTVIAMLAPNITWLFIGRAIQGACGPVVPIALLILRSETPDPARYGTLLGIIVAINGGIAGIDVILGGWIADHFGFRWILAFTLLLAVLAVGAALAWIPESRPSPNDRMDWPGVVLLCLIVVAGTYLVSGDGYGGFPNWRTPIYAGLVLICAAAFRWQEKHSSTPLIPPAAWRSRAIWAVPLNTMVVLTSIFAAVNLVIPSFSENKAAGLGNSATLTAVLFLAPYALIGWLVGPYAGHIAPRIGYRKTLRIGVVGSLVSLVIMATVGLRDSWLLGLSAVLLGITYAGFSNVMLNGLGIVLSPLRQPGLLPGLNAASFGIGAGLGSAILGQAITAGSPAGSTSTAGYTSALWLATGLTLLSVLTTFLLPKTGPAGDKI